MQIDMRLRDHIAVLEGVRALYQSDSRSSGPGIRAYLASLRPQVHAPGMEGIGIAVAMRQGTPAAAEAMLRQNYGRDIPVWPATSRSEEHTSELQSLMRISYAVFCLNKKKNKTKKHTIEESNKKRHTQYICV